MDFKSMTSVCSMSSRNDLTVSGEAHLLSFWALTPFQPVAASVPRRRLTVKKAPIIMSIPPPSTASACAYGETVFRHLLTKFILSSLSVASDGTGVWSGNTCQPLSHSGT